MPRHHHILVVEDDPEVSLLLKEGFESAGYLVSQASSKAALLRELDGGTVDLITLDLTLGNEDGIALAREIRAKSKIPIMMITGKGAPDDRVFGLEHGADDYVIKPFNVREVLLRTRTLLEGYYPGTAGALGHRSSQGRLEFEGRVLDLAKRELVDRNGADIGLTDAEFDLLTTLIQRPGHILTRDELCQIVFKRNWSPLERTIDGHIARLRRKIEPENEVPRLIKSVRGVGYVFTGPVRRV